MNEEPGQRGQEGTRHDTKMCHVLSCLLSGASMDWERSRRWEGGTVSCVWFWFRVSVASLPFGPLGQGGCIRYDH